MTTVSTYQGSTFGTADIELRRGAGEPHIANNVVVRITARRVYWGGRAFDRTTGKTTSRSIFIAQARLLRVTLGNETRRYDELSKD